MIHRIKSRAGRSRWRGAITKDSESSSGTEFSEKYSQSETDDQKDQCFFLDARQGSFWVRGLLLRQVSDTFRPHVDLKWSL